MAELMLVRLPDLVARDEVTDRITSIMGGTPGEQQIADGVFKTGGNFDHTLRANGLLVSQYPYEPFWEASWNKPPYDTPEKRMAALRAFYDQDLPQSYGVCDHWQQVTERWPLILTDDKTLVLDVMPIDKASQSEHGGWRWHKWGSYIGTKDPQHEYIADEDDSIQQVYCWHLYEVQVD